MCKEHGTSENNKIKINWVRNMLVVVHLNHLTYEYCYNSNKISTLINLQNNTVTDVLSRKCKDGDTHHVERILCYVRYMELNPISHMATC